MRPLVTITLLTVALALASAPAPVDAKPKQSQSQRKPKKKLRAMGFVTAHAGPGWNIVFDVRTRSDGMTVVRYRGLIKKAKRNVPFHGVFKGKLSTKNRRLHNSSGSVVLPKPLLRAYHQRSAASKLGTKASLWGTRKDGLDFSILPGRRTQKGANGQPRKTLSGFDLALVGFDVPLVFFKSPKVMQEILVRPLGGGFSGIAVSRTRNGTRFVTYAMKTSDRTFKFGTVQGKKGKPLTFKGHGARPSGGLLSVIGKMRFEKGHFLPLGDDIGGR